MVDLSIIIVNWNSAELVYNCVASIKQWITGVSYEVIVVDNCSDKSEANLLHRLTQESPWVSCIYSSKNLGFGGANNLAISACAGRYILFLNPDTYFLQAGFKDLLQSFADSRVGMVSCKLLNEDKTIQASCFYFPYLKRVVITALLLHKILPLKLRRRFAYSGQDHEAGQKPDWVLGAFMLVRREVIEQIGGFDQSIFMYGEDMDLCYRIRRLGFEILYRPDFAIVHYGGSSGKQAWSDAKKEVMVYRAIFGFYHKHIGQGKLLLARLLYAIGALLKIGLYSLECIRPGQAELGLNQIKTQWLILSAQIKGQ